MKIAIQILAVVMVCAAVVATIWWGFFLLWNFVAVALGLPELTFWQSVGLLVLLAWVASMFKNKKDD
jgi:hypothetical protein|tara:strand:+ start:92 stop:292 length:201 start_codon:yes stop_codon:yes gene_type:complete